MPPLRGAASRTAEELSPIVEGVVRINSTAAYHLHLYGASSHKGAAALRKRFAGNDDYQPGREFKLLDYNCVLVEAKALVEEIELESKNHGGPKCVVLLSRAEEMGRFGKELLKTFINRFKTRASFTLVTVSTKPWSKIESECLRFSISSPLQFYVADTTEEEKAMVGGNRKKVLINAVVAACPKQSRAFVEFVIGAVEMHYSSLQNLSHIVKYVGGRCTARGIDVSSQTMTPLAFKAIGEVCRTLKNDAAFAPPGTLQESARVCSDYPLFTRYVILAAYCASYNPTNTDARFFFKGPEFLHRRRRAPRRTQQREKLHETGPRPFDNHRLLFILFHFWRIYSNERDREERILVLDLNKQLAMLTSSGILKLVSAPNNLDQQRYRCLCSLAFAERIARSIDAKLDLHIYLADDLI